MLPWHLIIIAPPLFPCSSRPVRTGMAHCQLGQRTTHDQALIRQLIIFRMLFPVLTSETSQPRTDSAGSLLFSWSGDLNSLHASFILPQCP